MPAGSMKNRLFDAQSLAVLTAPRRWKLLSSLFPPELRAIRDGRHEEWSRQNTHAHPNQEILVALHGSAPYGYLGQVYRCPPGAVIIFDGNEPHDAHYPRRGPAALHLWIHLVEDRVFVNTIQRGAGKGMPLSAMKCSFSQYDMGVDVRRILAACRSRGELSGDSLRMRWDGAFRALIGRIVEEGYRAGDGLDRTSIQAQTIETIRRHLFETGGSGAKLDNLARIAGYSKFHFLQLFKTYSGQTVHKYVDWCRVQRTTQLRQEGRTLKEIGAVLGFSCQAAFSRWFRKHCAAANAR